MATFLSARWRNLVMLNYAVDPGLLADRVPPGTVLDAHDDRCWVSLVGFMFLDTVVMGVPIPGHRDFEELNLRFYVRRNVPDVDRGASFRRGVVFVREIVPRVAIATVARLVYNEPYECLPMRHSLLRAGERITAATLQIGDVVAYGFEQAGRWGEIRARVASSPQPSPGGSHANFITEHYWGYTASPAGFAREAGTDEYEVTHPPWELHDADEGAISGDLEALYGADLARALDRAPDSALIAVGSAVSVLAGNRVV